MPRPRFDIEGFKHGIRLWTIVLEISVLMASFPSEEIAKLSYQIPHAGLGLRQPGRDADAGGHSVRQRKGRAICAALTAILTGESYATSAEMARELGRVPRLRAEPRDMLRVIRNHRRAAYDVATTPPRKAWAI
jgi:ribonucleoside-diphosphate reductase alpha chain